MTDHPNSPPPPSPWGRRPEDPGPDGPRHPKRPPHGVHRKSRFTLFLLGVIAFLLLLIGVAWLLPDESARNIQMGGLLYDGLLLAFVGAGLWAHVASSPGQALRHLAGWVIIGGILALGYSVWTGAGRLGGELDVTRGIQEEGSISFRADRSGHYFVRARVNGAEVLFMVDTGASDVALTRKDANRIGLPVDRIKFDRPYSTANGITYGAGVVLKEIELGPIQRRNIRGSIVKEGLEYSLLGMSFLNQLSGYKVSNGILTLYP
ncbi:retropepsin-like aspartic protease family protein [Paremcibacter congregatus]|uniref:TIGR02281 family clan AA aspartic protease n=1 Tax=Paremcibacter congregatus TaxID=2043170 RepID=A0A2G4YRM0_9PROT|nr:TIGR02281 family clan AA aspartic protease [Paremcibacter congregatus]PHZ84972.1 hypothetical protein CRD36_09630 [Paremcibacter congregatus]QDE26053.1 TIGR02281 family clan AA aspartic protease [Paremcibacter congregatus]